MVTSTIRTMLALAVCCVLLLLPLRVCAAAEPLRVVATTFPIYQLTRNVTAGVDGVEVDLMIPAPLGCPHDYALLPQDMRKLARAYVLVANGLGMETFLGLPVQRANPNIKVIDSSRGVGDLLTSSEGQPGLQQLKGRHIHNRQGHGDKGHGHDSGLNPHLFASPRQSALLAANIAKGLAGLAPAHAASFAANAQAYGQRLNQLADDFVVLGKRLRNNRIITQHGVFDYLARDMGLEVVAVIQAHAGQDPSAAEVLAIVKTARAKKAAAVFTEPQYPEAVGAMIAREAGLKAARLDPGANGPEQAPLDYYEQVMRTNLTILEQTLGGH